MSRILTDTKHIVVNREDANYDRACDSACRIASALFGLDEDGYMPIVILFVQHKMYAPGSHHYMFDALVEKDEREF